MITVIGTAKDYENFKKFCKFSNELFTLMKKYGIKSISSNTPNEERFKSHHITVCGESGKPEIIGMWFDGDGKSE